MARFPAGFYFEIDYSVHKLCGTKLSFINKYSQTKFIRLLLSWNYKTIQSFLTLRAKVIEVGNLSFTWAKKAHAIPRPSIMKYEKCDHWAE